jgi:hypothetical protein
MASNVALIPMMLARIIVRKIVPVAIMKNFAVLIINVTVTLFVSTGSVQLAVARTKFAVRKGTSALKEMFAQIINAWNAVWADSLAVPAHLAYLQLASAQNA